MNNFRNKVMDVLRGVRKVWIVTAVAVLGLIVGLVGYNSDPVQRAIAARQNKNEPAVNVAALATPLPASGTGTSSTVVPDVAAATAIPGANQPVTASDLDALTVQMQTMMNSLNGMMQQLDQKGAVLPPATQATSVDLQPLLVELQAIQREMEPLMIRVQADLQGNPTAEELASVRAQLEQIQLRMGNLMNQIQAARNGTAPVASAPTYEAMPGMSSSAPSMDSMMQMMNDMQMQMNNMAMNGGMSTSGPSMDQMMQMMDDMMQTMDQMMGMSSMSDPMSGTSPTNAAMMDDMMMMMDNMMNMMDNMMQMDMSMPDM